MLSIACAPLAGVSLSTNPIKAEVVSGDLRGVAGDPAASLFSTAKLAFSGKLDLGKFTSTWRARYDSKANKIFIKDLSLIGSATQKGAKLSYEVTQPFSQDAMGDVSANLKLTTPSVGGYKLTAEYDTGLPNTVKTLSLPLGPYDVAGVPLKGQAQYLGASKAMKYVVQASKSLTSLKATVVQGLQKPGVKYDLEASTSYEVGSGREVSASITNSKVLSLEYVDAATDPSGTWTLSAEASLDEVAKPELVLKRGWSF